MIKLLRLVDKIEPGILAHLVYTSPIDLLKFGREGTKFEGEDPPRKLLSLARFCSEIVTIGDDYTKEVKKQILKAGKNPKKWQTDDHLFADPTPKYKSGNVYSHRKTGILYVKFFPDDRMPRDSLFIDVVKNKIVPVTQEEMEAFFKNPPEKKVNKKQKLAGVAREVLFRLVKVDHIRFLKCGEKEFNRMKEKEKKWLKKIMP